MLHVRQMVELAALVSAHSERLIEGPAKIPDAPLEKYWQHSRTRLQGWMLCLNEHLMQLPQLDVSEHHTLWKRTEPVIEEILIGEVLTRVWATVLTAADRQRRICHAEPLGRSAMVGHLEARHRALSLILNGSHVPKNELAKTDRLRRRTERWTDLLLGHLVKRYGVGEFAFDERRALDFGEDQLSESAGGTANAAWEFILTGLRLAFPPTQTVEPHDLKTHDGIMNSIVACFPTDAFQSSGPLKSDLSARISRSSLHPEGPPQQQQQQQQADVQMSRPEFQPQLSPPLQTPDSEPKRLNFAELRKRFERDQ